MSYQIIEILLPRVNHYITNSDPGIYDLGAISGSDALTLKVVFVVLGFSGAGAGAVKLQQSWDGGLIWTDVPIVTTPTVTANGEYTISVDGTSGLLSTKVRLVVTPAGVDSFYLAKLYRSSSTSHVLFPKELAVTATSASVFPVTFQYGPGGVFVATKPTYDTTTPASNRGFPTVILSGEGESAIKASLIAVGAQDGITGSASIKAIETKSVMFAFDGAAHKEVQSDTNGYLVTKGIYNRGPAGVFTNAIATKDTTTPTNNLGIPVVLITDDAESPAKSSLIAVGAQDGITGSATIKALETKSVIIGWDAVNNVHKEVAVSATGQLVSADTHTLSESYVRDCSTSALNTGAWSEVITSTAAAYSEWRIFNGTSNSIRIAKGAAGAEAFWAIIPPGGDDFRLSLAAGTRISLQPYVNCTSGEIIINAFG